MPDRIHTILYIDDDVALGRLVQKMLSRRGYIVEHLPDAGRGLARVDVGGVDVLILDHDLGTSSGMEVLEAVRARQLPLPVVYVTASLELSVAVEALKSGAADYVVKTVGEDFEVLLVSALEQSIEKARLVRQKERAEREVREAHDRALVLLSEVNHRVANSLALVNSLVRIQGAAVEDPAAKTALEETQARISAIANLHRSLYTSDDVRTVDLAAYLTSLVGELGMSISSASATPDVRVETVPVSVKTDKAISIGLIVTELVTNAVKYAYPDGGGEVRVRLSRGDGNRLRLMVEDDGVGWQAGVIKGTGLGSKIIAAMARSLGTELSYAGGGAGTRAVMEMDVGQLLLKEELEVA